LRSCKKLKILCNKTQNLYGFMNDSFESYRSPYAFQSYVEENLLLFRPIKTLVLTFLLNSSLNL
jgi:hypothetical protein